ncbi:MAG TPA: 3-phosphoshikimate 1-carboxyvinyltransferase [Ktedonobacteraceae bacterium]|nr:3-phosphoshikimate 1-carboxyvinyltransferase [Ktedonobacteraceae bacterium]
MNNIVSQNLTITPTELLQGVPDIPSSKYYMLRYLLAATLAQGESSLHYPAHSDDSEALFRGCRALGAELEWQDEQRQVLRVKGTELLGVAGREREATVIEVGNAGAVLRLLLGVGAMLPDVTFTTAYPQSLGKRPNRELLEALTRLGANCEGQGPEGLLPIRIRGGNLHGGEVEISGARSSQYLSSLLFLAPLLPEGLEIQVVDQLKSQPLVSMTLNVLEEAGIVVEHDRKLSWFAIEGGQQYQPRRYELPGDYPSAAALLAAVAVTNDPASRITLNRLRPGAEDGEALLDAFKRMGADLQRQGETVTLRGGRRLHGIELDGDKLIDSIPVLVALASFADGESYFYNIESLHYKESDRILDLCAELRKAGCAVTPRQDAIVVRGQPQGIEGGVSVEGHNDHRLLMALTIAGLRSRRGLTLCGVEHIAKSYPDFFEVLKHLGARITKPQEH